MDKTIIALRSHEAILRLRDPRFRQQWSALLADCQDVSAFQGPDFVETWYGSYGPTWQVVLLLMENQSSQLVALWPLACRDGRWVTAGAQQAEYQTWLARPDVEVEFLRQALGWLQPRMGRQSLRIKYLSSPERLAALMAVAGSSARSRQHRRPLMKLDAKEIRASLAKKGNKSRLNRLVRLGDVQFEVISELLVLDAHLRELALFYDLRQGAVNDSTPFREDPAKFEFLRQLFLAARAEVVVAVLTVAGRAAAGFWGLRSQTQRGAVVHLGMLMHSPVLAEYSPGKLLLLKLGEALLSQGVGTLDLTPGGDPWKERFANEHDEVFEVEIWASALDAKREAGRELALKASKQALALFGVSSAKARALLVSASKLAQPARWTGLRRRLWAWLLGERREYRVYRADRELAASIATGPGRDPALRVNDIGDLLQFQPTEAWQTHKGFWSQALVRLEAGHHVYTVSGEGTLLHSGWIVYGERESRVSEVGQVLHLPEGSVSLYDFGTHPTSRGRGMYRNCLRAMLADAFAQPKVRWAHIGVLADNHASRHVIESLGFEYVGSMRRWSRWGRSVCELDAGLRQEAVTAEHA